MTLKPEDKVLVKNLCAWPLYFKRLEGHGDVKIAENGKTRLSVEEVQAQVDTGNKFFIGEDGRGSNARIYIDSKELRVALEFEREATTVVKPEEEEDVPPLNQ